MVSPSRTKTPRAENSCRTYGDGRKCDNAQSKRDNTERFDGDPISVASLMKSSMTVKRVLPHLICRQFLEDC
jgi:hypothetical protein